MTDVLEIIRQCLSYIAWVTLIAVVLFSFWDNLDDETKNKIKNIKE